MDANRYIAALITAAIGCCLAVAQGTPLGQQTRPTVRHHRIPVETTPAERTLSAMSRAEQALDQKDYRKAEELLASIRGTAGPSAYRLWFDYGRLYAATRRTPEAIEAYRKSVTAKPDLFESNLGLGLLLAASGAKTEAAKYLRAATQLQPSNSPAQQEARFTAWLGLGEALNESAPDEAVAAYLHAIELRPSDFEPHLGAAQILERKKDFAGAEKHYLEAARLNPQSSEALAALADLYVSNQQLSKAEPVLRKYVSLNPQDARSRLQLGRVLSKLNRAEEAKAELEAAARLAPQETSARRELAALAAQANSFDLAESQYRALVKENPQDPELHYALGTVLMNARKFPEAEQELISAVRLQPALTGAYGNLATVAHENQHYELAIKALDARGKLLPEDAGTYFLRATAYDHLNAFKEASQNYHLFLSAANGKFPNQEWQARHRLIAIEPKR